MKKILTVLPLLILIASCGGGSDQKNSANATADTAAATQPAANDLSSNPDYQKGLALIAANDCLTCHKVSEKLTGPAYQDVANKYENTDDNIKMLAGKILKGGSGVWGNVAMTPHPALAEADAEQMVKYIMLLKTNK